MSSVPLKDLVAVFSEAMHSPHSSFYRDLYAQKGYSADGIGSLDEWRRIPLWSKRELAAIPFRQRAFRPLEGEEVVHLHTSSGTSKSPVVLNLRDRLFQADLRGVKRYADRLLFIYGLPWLYGFYAQAGIASVGGSLADFPESARVAARFEIQAIHGTPSQLLALTPHLQKEMDLKDIRVLILWGERISSVTYTAIMELYPNALIFPMYGGAETQGFHATACEALARTKRNCVHFLETSVYPELVDTSESVIEGSDAEGELVLTVLWKDNLFPVIRFRTGDLARRVQGLCECNRDTYEILGRSDYDRVTITGGQLRSEELERALGSFAAAIHDDYALHVFDSASSGKLKMELHVRPRGSDLDLKKLANEVAKELYVGPARTLASGVAAGWYEPLECRDISDNVQTAAKKTRIVRHV